MHKLKFGIVTFVVLFVVGCGGGGGSDPNVPRAGNPMPQPPVGVLGDGGFEDLVEWVREANDLPAMAAVVLKDGQPVDLAAVGLRSVSATERVTSDDRWHIGSLTKGLTSTLVGAMVEGGYLTWNTRPLDVWPELAGSIHPDLHDTTIRQLLSHTSGIERVDAVSSRYADEAAGSLQEKRKAFAVEFLAKAPVYRIGTHNYSNAGYIIVGAMIEAVTGLSWEECLTSYVLAPLGMYETGFGAPGEPGQLTQPWGHWDTGGSFDPVSPGADADNPQIFGPAGTVHTTLHDYAKFMAAHIDGERGIDGVLSAETFKILHTPVVSGAALGWGVQASVAFPGAQELAGAGSNQRWYALVRLVPELGGGAIFIANAGGNKPRDAIDELEAIVVERFTSSQ